MVRAFLRRTRWWLAVVQVVLLLATLATPVGAATDPVPLSGIKYLQLLQTYSIIRGDNQGNFNLDKPISRAELATVLVRSLGGEQEAALYGNLSSFTDVTGHWAAGNLTYAAMKGLLKGDGDNRVRPNDQVTYGEALTMILRLVKQEPAAGEWPLNVLMAAGPLGLVPDGIGFNEMKQPAVRGPIFVSLGIAISSIKLPDSGKTVLATYVKTTPPAIDVTIPSSTKQETLTVSGAAKGAVSVTVNGTPATLTGDQFTASVKLTYGDNTISIAAQDEVGNVGTKELKVTRQLEIASLVVNGPTTVRANDTISYSYAGYDDKNQPVPLTGLTATVSGNIGTFDVTTGTLRTGSATANGSIIFKIGNLTKKVDVAVQGTSSKARTLSVQGVSPSHGVSITKPMTVQVYVTDENGATVTEDNGRPVTLDATGVGVAVTPKTAYTVNGVATFSVVGTTPGSIVYYAKSEGLNSGVGVGLFSTSTKVVLVADNPNLSVLGPTSTHLHAELWNENGLPIPNNSGSDIVVKLSATGAPSTFTSESITIRRGANSSTILDDSWFNSTGTPGMTVVSGTLTSGHPYSVEQVAISISPAATSSGSTAIPGGARIQILNLNPPVTPPGSATVQVRMVDGNGQLVTTGSYAFRIKVDSSNGETKTNGLPGNASVTLGGTVYSPVDTGSDPSGNFVFGRTVNGTANLTVSYDRTGILTLTPVTLWGDRTAVADDSTSGTGSSSSGFNPVGEKITFSGSAAKINVTVDSQLGTGQAAGVLKPNSPLSYSIHATITDANGGPITNAANTLQLVPVGSASFTSIYGLDTRTAVGGAADFAVKPGGSTGCDTYRITSTGLTQSADFGLCVRTDVPAKPRIIAVRGSSGTNDKVYTSDTGMEIELAWDTTGTDTWVLPVVYRNGGVIYTGPAVNMSGVPRVTVPKSVLSSGSSQFQVALRNGIGESDRSAYSNTVAIDYDSTNVGFNSARYDAASHTLNVYAFGLATTGAQIDTSRLQLRYPGMSTPLSLNGATWSTPASDRLVLDVSGATSIRNTIESASFADGNITLEALSGWYYYPAQGVSGAPVSAKPVTPFGNITAAQFDLVNNQITITGTGFTTGSIDLSKIVVSDSFTNYSMPLNSTNVSSWNRQSDTTITVNLSSTGATALKNPTNFASGNARLSATTGWLYVSAWAQNTTNGARSTSGVPLSAKVNVTSISYVKGSTPGTSELVIRGSGFWAGTTNSSLKGTVVLANLLLKDYSQTSLSRDLTGTGTSVNILSDNEIHITLDSAVSTDFETNYTSAYIYVVGNAGWFKDVMGDSATAILDRGFRVTTQ